jgi:hypothetical protein
VTQAAIIARKALNAGVSSLQPGERDVLHALFIKETRKGAFKPDGNDDHVLGAFLQHVEQGFAPGNYLTVVDFLPYFRQIARSHEADQTPLASLIIYAAWGEHWVNVLIAMGSLRAGVSDAEVQAYFATQPRFEDKMSRVRAQSVTELPKKEFDWLVQVMKTRNDYLYYTWAGRAERALTQSLRGIGPLVRKADRMIEGLLAFEQRDFDAPFEGLALRLFSTVR